MTHLPTLAAAGLAAVLAAGPSVAEQAATTTAPPTASRPIAGEHGTLVIEESVFDAGTVDRGTHVRHAFELKNTGKAPLNIQAKPG